VITSEDLAKAILELKESQKATDKKLKSLGIHLDGITKTTIEVKNKVKQQSLVR